MNLNEVDIEVKHSGLLEVPTGKEVDQLPQSHFQKLIDKKGYEAIIRGLTNLEVWNKNRNPKLSQWASSMADKLKKANKQDESYIKPSDFEVGDTVYLDDGREVKIVDKLHKKYLVQNVYSKNNDKFLVDHYRVVAKNESYSQRFQQALDEMNAKMTAKLGTKAWNATKSGAKKLVKGAGEAVKRAGTTAQNAIVAGASAPIGVKIANTYTNPPKKREQKYSASDVAAIATALKKNESYTKSLQYGIALLEEKIEKKNDLKDAGKTIAKSTATGAGVGGAMGAGIGGAIANKGARLLGATQNKGIGKFIRRGATGIAAGVGSAYGVGTGALKGLAAGTAIATGKYIHDKRSKSESLLNGIDRLDQLLEFAAKKSNKSYYKKLPDPPAKKLKAKIVKAAQKVSGNTPPVDPKIVEKRKKAAEKAKITKAKNREAAQAKLQQEIMKPLTDAAKGKKGGKTTTTKTTKVTKSTVIPKPEADIKRVKSIFQDAGEASKALRRKAIKGGLIGAGALGLAGAAGLYGYHKYKNREKYNY